MNIPLSKRPHISAQFESYKDRKEECLKEFLKSHPAPSWWVVAVALYSLGLFSDNPAYHTSLEMVVSMYPTGKCMSIHDIYYNFYYWGGPERAPHLPYCCAKSSGYIYNIMGLMHLIIIRRSDSEVT